MEHYRKNGPHISTLRCRCVICYVHVVVLPYHAVCLLLCCQVGRLVRSQEVGEEGRRRIFDAVGFTFINRLLATSAPARMEENISVSIFLSI